MLLREMQEYADLMAMEEHIPPVPLRIEKRMTRLLGKARYPSYMDPGYRANISLCKTIEQLSDAFSLSVVIHEMTHIITLEGHTHEFMRVSQYWHSVFGLYEDRRTKAYHGQVFYVAADGRHVPTTYLTKREPPC